MQPIEDEDPFELAGKNAWQQSDTTETFKLIGRTCFRPPPLICPTRASLCPKQRIGPFSARQRMSLEQHQVKSKRGVGPYGGSGSASGNAGHPTLTRRAYNVRKQFKENNINEIQPKQTGPGRVDQQRCEELTEQYKEQLLNAWDQFQTKQAAIQAKLEADRRANPVLSELITGKSPTQEEDKKQQTATTKTAGMGGGTVMSQCPTMKRRRRKRNKQHCWKKKEEGEGEREEQKERQKMEEEKEVSREREERDERRREWGEEEGKEEGGSVKEKDANDGGDEKKEAGEEEITAEKNGGGDEKEQKDGTAAAERNWGDEMKMNKINEKKEEFRRFGNV
ncbi:hypothetical protein niasHT_008838 [Heterodera trifolii]|uniref:Uncharacterized protein n=1 Tax=Heterodera trifolii TaxID=157864 RepID=A0ABD2LUM1_9BILA